MIRQTLQIAMLTTLLATGPTTALAAGSDTGKPFACADVPEPVVSLSFGSRYTADSKTRSEIDTESNAEVDRALEPVDKLITYLSKTANDALASESGRSERVACVGSTLAAWASAGALTELDTLNANLAIGPRFAGLALAFLQADELGGMDAAHREAIVPWLKTGAETIRTFFDGIPEMNASRNNLRAWSGLAVGAIGLAAKDETLLDWGRESFRLVACAATADGSLPLEMGRADKALHYQIHAVSPLVVSAVLLASPTFDGFTECDGALPRIVGFTLAAMKDPSIVTTITGKKQSFKVGDEVKQSFSVAWAEPYLGHVADADLEAFVAGLRPLSNSKLGGNLTRIYGGEGL